MNEPKRGEIRKAERLACKLTGKQDCRVTGYYTEGANGDFQTFQCEVLSDGGKMREIDIYVDADCRQKAILPLKGENSPFRK